MKNFVFVSAMLIMLVALSGCSGSDGSSEDCPVIECQNGGVFIDCACDCPEGYSGSDCSSQISPEAIYINNIRVTFFPNQTPGLSNWDTNGLPDIYLELDRASNSGIQNLYTAGVFYEDAISNGTLYYDFTPNTPILIDKMFLGHVLTLIDYDQEDSFPSADDTIGSVAFYPYESTNSFPTTLIVKDDSLPLRFELSLTYQWE